jgi:hypothetical protein
MYVDVDVGRPLNILIVSVYLALNPLLVRVALLLYVMIDSGRVPESPHFRCCCCALCEV